MIFNVVGKGYKFKLLVPKLSNIVVYRSKSCFIVRKQQGNVAIDRNRSMDKIGTLMLLRKDI